MGLQGFAFTVFLHESLELSVPIGICVKKIPSNQYGQS